MNQSLDWSAEKHAGGSRLFTLLIAGIISAYVFNVSATAVTQLPGMGVLSETDFAQWERRALLWNDRVIESIRKISEADAEWFSILDVVTVPRVGAGFNFGPFQKLFGEHDLRVKRLGKMIYRLWKD